MKTRADFGTDADKKETGEYCTHCYQHGQWIQPEISQEEMQDACRRMMVEYGVAEEEAAIFAACIPALKRWKK